MIKRTAQPLFNRAHAQPFTDAHPSSYTSDLNLGDEAHIAPPPAVVEVNNAPQKLGFVATARRRIFEITGR